MAAGIVQLPTAAIVVAIPTVHTEFGTSLEELQWLVTAFYIPFSALLIAAGRIADIFGRRRTLVAGTLLFAAGSVLAAASPDVDVLILGIAICGAGGALMMPSSMAVLTNLFTGERRGLAIGMWGAATELISGVGVVVGGLLTGELDWRWIFVVDAIFAGLIVLFALRGCRESNDPTAPRSVDVPGVVLTATGLTAMTLALIQGAAWGWTSAAIVGLLAAAVIAFAGFAVVERRSKHPLVDFGFFRQRNFTGATIVIFVLDFSFGALLFFLPLYFQEMLGYSPTKAGVLLLPLTGLMVIASPLGGRVAAKVGPRPPIVTGLALMATAVFLISELSTTTTFSGLWLPTAMMGFGVGFALTPMNLAAMNAISRDHAGAASGILVTLSGLGATLGVAVTGAIFNALEASKTVDLAAAHGAHLTEAQARDLDGILAGTPAALHSLEHASGISSATATDVVREAFVGALGTSLKVSAALIVAGLTLALVLMRRQDPVDEDVPVPIAAPPHRPLPRRATA